MYLFFICLYFSLCEINSAYVSLFIHGHAVDLIITTAELIEIWQYILLPGMYQDSWYGTKTTRNPTGTCGAVESSENR